VGVEANFGSPTDIETRRMRSNKISFRVPTVQSTSSARFSTGPGESVDTILGPSPITHMDPGYSPPKQMCVAQDQSHLLRDCDGHAVCYSIQETEHYYDNGNLMSMSKAPSIHA